MSKIDPRAGTLIGLFGGVTKTAAAISVNKAIPSRWTSDGPKGNHGKVPPHYNGRIISAAKTIDLPESAKKIGGRKAFLAAVRACLDEQVCPACGQELPAGAKVDKRLAG